MSIQSEIQRLQGAKQDIKYAIENKGVTVPSSEKIDSYDDYIEQIKTVGTYQQKQVTPTTTNQEVVADYNYDALSKVIVEGDANLTSGNIKNGTQIFGVYGTYETPVNYQDKQVTPSAAGQVVMPDAGYDALSSVSVDGDVNLSAENIKKDVSIFGVTGTLSGGGNYQQKSVTPRSKFSNSNTRPRL